MAAARLRVYYGPEEQVAASTPKRDDSNMPRVPVPLREIFPLLIDALNSQRTWLQDFEDEEIAITPDLYEVLLAFQHYRRPSA